MVDGGNESLGVAVLNLTGTRSAARPGPPARPGNPPPALALPPAYCVMHAANNRARDVTLHYKTLTLILIGMFRKYEARLFAE